jgi:phosphopantothenoylcysteine decarboxylase/phosphopantothenate--cysteine ligase
MMITAGPTREPLDPVRFLSNRSTGTTGYTLAGEAARAGYDVLLISGPVCLTEPEDVRVRKVVTALDMKKAVDEEAGATDILVMAAAVCDFRPSAPRNSKIKKDRGAAPALALEKNPDILEGVPSRPGLIKVGFALETEKAEKNGYEKLEKKGLDMIVVNMISPEAAPFGGVQHDYLILRRGRAAERIQRTGKRELARRILEEIRDL